LVLLALCLSLLVVGCGNTTHPDHAKLSGAYVADLRTRCEKVRELKSNPTGTTSTLTTGPPRSACARLVQAGIPLSSKR
jgi:hypothetical protein